MRTAVVFAFGIASGAAALLAADEQEHGVRIGFAVLATLCAGLSLLAAFL